MRSPSAPASRRRTAGSVLLVAIAVLVLGSIAAALVAGSVLLRLRLTRDEAARVQVQALADAAMAEGLASLAANNAFFGNEEHPLAPGEPGLIWNRVTPLAEKQVTLRAGGIYGARRRSVRAVVDLTFARPVVLSWEFDADR